MGEKERKTSSENRKTLTSQKSLDGHVASLSELRCKGIDYVAGFTKAWKRITA